MSRTRVEDPAVRRRQILQAAQAVLKDKPYQSLVMDDVAHKAGLSKGLLYVYFKDKEQLFAAVALNFIAQLRELIRQPAPGGSPLNRLLAIVHAVLAFGERNKEFPAQFVGEQLLSSPQAPALLKAWQAFLRELGGCIADCRGTGGGWSRDPVIAADALMQLMQVFLGQKYLYRRLKQPLPSYAGEVVDLFVNGFGGRRAGAL